jgi:hypothetical protein
MADPLDKTDMNDPLTLHSSCPSPTTLTQIVGDAMMRSVSGGESTSVTSGVRRWWACKGAAHGRISTGAVLDICTYCSSA